jgi:ATP-dependent Lhr-like helicase
MQEGSLRWLGGEKHSVAFCITEELPLLQNINTASPAGTPRDDQVKKDALFPDDIGRYDFSTLMRVTGLSPGELSDRLWEGVWQGQVANDTFAALRKGIMTDFEAPHIVTPTSRGRRAGHLGFSRWKASLPFAGNWFLLPTIPPVDDLLENEEQLKERVRILLDRYGILFRELLEREAVSFRWGKIFRALRLMELSGEVLSGYFFQDIPGLQFISPHAFQVLQSILPEKKIYWLNAVDPASLCGIQVDSLKQGLPRRLPGNHLVYHGTQLVVTSQQNGRILTITVPADNPYLSDYFGFLKHLLCRQFQPLHRVVIDTINDVAAMESPYLAVLRAMFDVNSQNESIVLYRRMNKTA